MQISCARYGLIACLNCLNEAKLLWWFHDSSGYNIERHYMSFDRPRTTMALEHSYCINCLHANFEIWSLNLSCIELQGNYKITMTSCPPPSLNESHLKNSGRRRHITWHVKKDALVKKTEFIFYSAIPRQKDLSDTVSLVSVSTITLNNGRLHKRLKIQYKFALKVSQSWKRTNKTIIILRLWLWRLIWRVIQTRAFYVNGIVGRDSRELCHLGPFVVIRQYC